MNRPIDTAEFPDLDVLRGRAGCKWRRFAQDVVPAWIADMDALPAPVVRDAVIGAVDRGELGYGDDDLADQVGSVWAERCDRRWGWRPDPAGVRLLHDVVQGIALAVHTLTRPGDAVVVLGPSYPPILEQLDRSGRRTVTVELRRDEDFELDAERFRDAVGPDVTLVILVNPHNPTGRCFTRTELEGVADAVRSSRAAVLADEIHADLVWDGRRHIPFASLDEAVGARTVTLASAAKSFNVAGLKAALAHVGSEVSARVDGFDRHLLGEPSVLGVAAMTAAWRDGDAWLGDVSRQLVERRDQLRDALAAHLPEVDHRSPDATYLAWLDLRPLGLGDEPAAFFETAARVALGRGLDFGPAGSGHARLNFATSRQVLDEIIERMVTAVDLRRDRSV